MGVGKGPHLGGSRTGASNLARDSPNARKALPSFPQSLRHLANSYTFPANPALTSRTRLEGLPGTFPYTRRVPRVRQSNRGGAVCLSDQRLPTLGLALSAGPGLRVASPITEVLVPTRGQAGEGPGHRAGALISLGCAL